MKEPKPHVSPITEPKFTELSSGGKYIEGTPLPMKDGDTYWVEVICDKDGKRLRTMNETQIKANQNE